MRLTLTMVRETANFWVFEAPIKNNEIGVFYLAKKSAAAYYHVGAQIEIIQSARPSEDVQQIQVLNRDLKVENNNLRARVEYLESRVADARRALS